mmetsp:Transcript_21259/g.63702  ORF Transcript_21259/g.63702 Transcript_21259/m.63702 type:complete len:384 (-) Transcript_21259:769-1920(-)
MDASTGSHGMPMERGSRLVQTIERSSFGACRSTNVRRLWSTQTTAPTSSGCSFFLAQATPASRRAPWTTRCSCTCSTRRTRRAGRRAAAAPAWAAASTRVSGARRSSFATPTASRTSKRNLPTRTTSGRRRRTARCASLMRGCRRLARTPTPRQTCCSRSAGAAAAADTARLSSRRWTSAPHAHTCWRSRAVAPRMRTCTTGACCRCMRRRSRAAARRPRRAPRRCFRSRRHTSRVQAECALHASTPRTSHSRARATSCWSATTETTRMRLTCAAAAAVVTAQAQSRPRRTWRRRRGIIIIISSSSSSGGLAGPHHWRMVCGCQHAHLRVRLRGERSGHWRQPRWRPERHRLVRWRCRLLPRRRGGAATAPCLRRNGRLPWRR